MIYPFTPYTLRLVAIGVANTKAFFQRITESKQLNVFAQILDSELIPKMPQLIHLCLQETKVMSVQEIIKEKRFYKEEDVLGPCPEWFLKLRLHHPCHSCTNQFLSTWRTYR
jgi:hypothetical protein